MGIDHPWPGRDMMLEGYDDSTIVCGIFLVPTFCLQNAFRHLACSADIIYHPLELAEFILWIQKHILEMSVQEENTATDVFHPECALDGKAEELVCP